MNCLRLAGFFDRHPALFTIDQSLPHSMISSGFLFRHNINPLLSTAGKSFHLAKVTVPSLGGFYTSKQFRLVVGPRCCNTDIVLGSDWLSQCRPTVETNTFGRPADQTVNGLPDNHGWIANDDFLPYSLLHKRSDQYRFSGGLTPESLKNVEFGDAATQFHEQVSLDATCSTILNPPLKRGVENVTQSEVLAPLYNENLLYQLVRIGVSDEDWLFYSKVIEDHAITPTLASADGARMALLQHLFTGRCLLQNGAQCKDVVEKERWPQSMGVKLIDLVAEWTDENKLSTREVAYICQAIGHPPSATKQRRSLLAKLASRRRRLLHSLDASEYSLEDTLGNLGSSLKLETVRAMCDAHDIPCENLERSDLIDNLLEHISGGSCASDVGPGCDYVMKGLSPTVQDVVHTQIDVLEQLHAHMNARQLHKVLSLHGIEFSEGDSKKMLKYRLALYIGSLRKNKLKEAQAEREKEDKLQKLEKIRQEWPRMVPPQLKERLVKNLRKATSSSALSTFTCACCGRELPLKERIQKYHTDVKLGVLKGPTNHWNDDKFAPPPTPFATGPLVGKLLDVRGVRIVNEEVAYLDLCVSCHRHLQRNTVPKHALANCLYLGSVPDELSDLTMVEESLIARARAKSWIVKLQETEGGTSSPTAQRGLKGHTIMYPQQPGKLATVLPPPIDEVLSFVCIIFVGSGKVTPEWLRTKAKPLVVRREKVYNALRWLKDNNPLYKDIQIATDALDELPESDVLSYHIEHVHQDDAQEALVSSYDNITDPNGSGKSDTFESVVIADVNTHMPHSQLAATAIRHVKEGRPFVQVRHGPNPMNEFFNADLFPMAYPTLFPYGCGGFEDGNRSKPISMKEHVKYLFSLKDRRFQTHNSFLFTAFNVLQRRALLLHASLKVKKSYFVRFAKDFLSVSSESIGVILGQLEAGERIVAKTEEERRVLKLMKEVNLVTSKVDDSSAARVSMRNEIRALTMSHGMPSFYLTINPADTHNPIVKFLAGTDIDIDRMLEEDIPNFWEQSQLVSKNPTIAANFFNKYLKAFLKEVLGYTEGEINMDGGILGTVKAHYGCVEAQGRGSLHCHMLIWIEGALNPNEIREKVMEDVEWGRRLLSYLDDTITNVVPEDPCPEKHEKFGGKDPCTLRGANLDIEDLESRLVSRAKDVNQLAERVQRHRHSHTCYKHYKPGEDRTCRFDLSEQNFRAESEVDPDTGKVTLRCLDGLVNNFNVTILEAMRCNMDIQFIGSGESAKAMIYYVTDYITKSPLKSQVAYAALQRAVKKCEATEGSDDDFVVKSKRLLQKCSYALISHQEMSAQQVASYLMGYEDHFTSHIFGNLYWASFERFVDRVDPIKKTEAPDSIEEPAEGTEGQNDEENAGDDSEDESSEMVAWETPDDEEVTVSVNSEGRLTEMADQVADYTRRPEELNEYCLWDFVAKTVKVYDKKGKGTTVGNGGKLDDDSEEDMECSNDESDEELENDGVKEVVKRGRKPVIKYKFLEGHKERDRRYLRTRKRDVVPVPIGPGMLRRDDPEQYERYCRLMLILFKPWREVSDLREQELTWATTFGEFAAGLPVIHREIIINMQVLHECRDSRDDHMQTRCRQRKRMGKGWVLGDEGPGNDLEEVDMSEVLEHLSEMERMTSKKAETLNRETQECLKELDNSGWYESLRHEGGFEDDDKDVEIELPERENLEDEWKDFYEGRKLAWRQEAKHTEIVEQEQGEMIVSRVEDVEMEEHIVVDVASVEGRSAEVVDAVTVMENVAEEWTLNREQRRAFEIVARHTVKDKPEQLLMYLGGKGGTGKSRAVNALSEFFEKRNECRRFRLAAYTGVAARNIAGATLHALLHMNESGIKASVKAKRDLAAMWDGVDYLFVDEVSMIGCEMLYNISRGLTEAKGKTQAFGGVNMIFAGDFGQLPPIGDVRLYKNINTTGVSAGSTNRAQSKILGRLLWLSVETVVILHETMLQSGSENDRFVSLLDRLRSGVCSRDDYSLLRGRLLKNAKGDLDEEWKSAPVIVANNATRDAINVKSTMAYAEKTGRDMHWYHAVDRHKKSVITDPTLIENLEGQNSGQTKHRLRRIPLVMGMPVSINQNFDVRAGVVNGSFGYIRAVRYSEDTEGRRYLESCIVEIPGADLVKVDGLPDRHFPILPDVTDLKFEHSASHKCCVIKRKQVPVEPGFAVTAHKAQGQTMKKVIVDLAGCSGSEQPYVMASRSKSLEGLLILRDFEFNKITKRVSEDLRKEFDWLEILRLRTIVEYGVGDKVAGAKRKLKELGDHGKSGGKKKKLGTDDGQMEERKRLRGNR